MAKSKKIVLRNESNQRRDVILLKKKGSEPCPVFAGGSVEITEQQISPQLQEMLKRPDLFGLVLVEEPTASSRTSNKEKDEDKEDD